MDQTLCSVVASKMDALAMSMRRCTWVPVGNRPSTARSGELIRQMAAQEEEHLSTFDGLPTRKKLEMLSQEKGLPKGLHGFLNELKQQYTTEQVHLNCKPIFTHEYTLSNLKAQGYKPQQAGG